METAVAANLLYEPYLNRNSLGMEVLPAPGVLFGIRLFVTGLDNDKAA